MTKPYAPIYTSHSMSLKLNIFMPRNHEHGAALIMVLGMVAVIATWATTAAYEDMISIRRISNIQDEVRATMASESAHELIRLYLREDAKDTTTDSLEEDWALDMPPFPIDEGMITGVITDGNRYYNLNDLVDDSGNAIQNNVTQLQRLFTLLELDPSLVNALVDWMDANDTPYGASGAEDSLYFERDYQVKNARLDSWSELKLILGFDYATLNKLKTFAAVLPATNNGRTLINMNTASAEVLMMLFPNMDDMDAEAFMESRPYESKSTLNQQPWKTGGDLQRLSVSSDTFMVRTHASFGRANVREEFLLSRKNQNVQLVWRERLGWQF